MLSFAEYDQADALSLVHLVNSGQISATELCETAIARANSINNAIHAIITPLFQQARDKAQRADYSGAFLAGVPFLVQDIGSQLAGVRQTNGSQALMDFIPEEDDELIKRWKFTGLNILGKTNVSEFALQVMTESETFGACHNPWHLEHTSGGSNGGSAAAVAAGIVPLAGASDSSGSLRIPASCCGLFGLKPSRGRVPNGPHNPEHWFGATVQHVITRSVRDSALLLDLETGPELNAPYFLPPPEQSYRSEADCDPGRLRIGFSVQHPLDMPVDPEVVTAVKEAAHLLESLGHYVEEVTLPYNGNAIAKAYLMMCFAVASTETSKLRHILGRPAHPNDVESLTWLLNIMGHHYSAADFALSRQSWSDHALTMAQYHQEYDVLLTPTLAALPMNIGQLAPKPIEQLLLKLTQQINIDQISKHSELIDQIANEMLAQTPYTQIANLTGQPAMSVPLYWSSDNLPIGIQCIAPFAREDLLFSLAGQLERAQPWMQRRPHILETSHTQVKQEEFQPLELF